MIRRTDSIPAGETKERYRYRVLVRPQMPHVGEVTAIEGDPPNPIFGDAKKLDHINLVRGETKKLTITASFEEEFTGEVSFEFVGLPTGVQALPAVQLDQGKPPAEVTQNPEAVVPRQTRTIMVLLLPLNIPALIFASTSEYFLEIFHFLQEIVN